MILGTLSTFGTRLVLLGAVSKDPVQAHDVLRYALPTTLLAGSVLLGIYLGTCLLMLREVGIALDVLLILGITETLLQPFLLLCASEHHGLGYVARAQLLTILPLALRLVAAAIVFGLHSADPLGAYIYGYGLASAIALILILPTRPTVWPRPAQWRLPHWVELREAAGFAALNVTATGPAELDKTLASKLLPLSAAGVYTASARAIGAIILPISAMTLSALPRLFREGVDQPRQTGRLLGWMFSVALGYSLAIAGALWLAAPMFEWVFGAKYHNIAQVTRWLCLAVPGMAVRRVAGNALMTLGKPWMRVGFETFGLATLLLASIVLVTPLGAIGMPLALASSEWGMAVIGGASVYATCSLTSQNKDTVARPHT